MLLLLCPGVNYAAAAAAAAAGRGPAAGTTLLWFPREGLPLEVMYGFRVVV